MRSRQFACPAVTRHGMTLLLAIQAIWAIRLHSSAQVRHASAQR
nr:hypothetical protein [Pollutimonas thiosulfatoxidans]